LVFSVSEKLQMEIQQLVMDDGTPVEDNVILEHLPTATSRYAVKEVDTFCGVSTGLNSGL